MSSTRPKGIRRSLLIFIGIIFVITIIAILFSASETNEYIEHNFFKQGPIHDFFQTSKEKTFLNLRKELIVFQHIPRTSGDSMRTHLFNDVDYDKSTFYPYTKPTDTTTPPPPPPWKATFPDPAIFNTSKMIKGYFSRDDLFRISPRPILKFTILRHPIERVLSTFHFIKSYREFQDISYDDFFNFNSKYHKDNPVMDIWIKSFIFNEMTWQLGNNMHINYRNVSEEIVLERAKQSIRDMAYVGFYEDLYKDFFGLWESIFKDVEVPRIFPLIFLVGTFFAFPRLRVKKYSANLTLENMKLLEELTNLDRKLYDFACDHLGRKFVMLFSLTCYWVTCNYFCGCCCKKKKRIIRERGRGLEFSEINIV